MGSAQVTDKHGLNKGGGVLEHAITHVPLHTWVVKLSITTDYETAEVWK